MSFASPAEFHGLSQLPPRPPLRRHHMMVSMAPMAGYRDGSFPVAQPPTDSRMPVIPVLGWTPEGPHVPSPGSALERF